MTSISKALDDLKNELQNERDSSKFEKLVAALVGHLLDVPIAVASSGYQHGADAGPAGQQGRRFRLESKKYSDKTRFDERELRGEIAQAVARDDALEAWILITTRTVSEQLRQSLDESGDQHGVPVLVIDWMEDTIGPLAALCASAPDLVETIFSNAAGRAARDLQLRSDDAIDRLKRNLQSWCLGFESLRKISHERLDKIWNNPKESAAVFGQNVAGGSTEKKVKRKSVHDSLDHWWSGPARDDAPAVVMGREGVGKTWATLHWLIENQSEQPVILTIPSSAVAGNSAVSDTDFMHFLAERLYALTNVRGPDHWHRRLDRMLRRPGHEGPSITVWFDGLNQQPSVSWLDLLKVLQSESFGGRIRVIVSTRKHHFENRLSRLNGLVEPSAPIEVGRYDAEPGGELEQMLAYEGLRREDLRQDVLEMARTPRLFDLVVRFRGRFGETEPITLHRLLWEYGRDTLGVRAGKSFSTREWIEWLKAIASSHRERIQHYSLNSLGKTVQRPDLTPSEVDARLSDIIDGRFATYNASDELELTPTVIAHALGVALLNHLDRVEPQNFETLDDNLRRWLDPIEGFDHPPEILRASVSILIQQGRGSMPVTGVILTSWLQAQNVTDDHRQEIVELATRLRSALLEAIENSDTHDHESARHWAVKALCADRTDDDVALELIVQQARRWMGTIYRDIDTRRNRSDEHRKWREDHLSNLIGTHSAGNVSVVGVELNLVDRYPGLVKSAVPSILEGSPLCKALATFEAAATALAAGDHSGCWDALRWLCLLNEVDPDETAEGLRDLSKKVLCRIPEPGLHPDLSKRVAALLLRLTGFENDDKAAAHLNPDIGRGFNYERDYLSDPLRSMSPLERRHANVVLQDSGLAVQSRVKRIGELWLDPTFVPSDDFVSELRDLAASVDVERLDRSMGPTIHDVHFKEAVPAFARFAPDLLAELMRRKLRSLETCPIDSRYWSVISAKAHFLLSGEAEAKAATALRRKGRDVDEVNEFHAASRLLLMEIRDLPGQKQIRTVIQADLQDIPLDISHVLQPLTTNDVSTLVNQYDSALPKQQRDLLKLLAVRPVALNDYTWSWIRRFAMHEDDDYAKLAFIILNQADRNRFGLELLNGGWSWCQNKHIFVNDYGTDSLIEASSSVSFEELAPRVAPWRLLEAVRRRGADPAEVRVAAAIFGDAMTSDAQAELDLGSDVSVDMTGDNSLPFSYSVSPRRSENEIEAMQLALDPDANLQAHRRAIDTAATRIDEARRNGVTLFQAIFDYMDFKPVIEFAPDYVDRWLDGYSEPTAEFENRVHRAEGAFLALCEALLIKDPARGVELWRVLNETLKTRYVGAAGVDSLLHMVFRVPDSPEVEKLRNEIWKLKYVRADDRALLDLAIATTFNNQTQWLNELIERDRASCYAWRRARAMVLDGFRADNSLPVAEAWPDRELKTTNSRLKWISARSRWIEACARHWWKSYLDAFDPAKAYAAWVLFLRSADSRCRVWMREDIDAISESDDFFKLKMAHLNLNNDDLNRALKKRAMEFKKKFLYRKITEGIGPWT